MHGRRTSYFDRYASNSSGRIDELVAFQRGAIGSKIHLIASACYPFDSVIRVLSEPSFVLPAEGLPGARYLPGSQAMDIVEIEGEQLALKLFGGPTGYRATLQPHSGTQANQIVYNAILGPDDTVMCLRPFDGGHISHTVLIARRNPTQNYGLTADGHVDYEQLWTLARRHRPKLIIVGGSSLPRSIDFAKCAEIANEVGAILHADISHTATFVAAGLHPDAFPHCDFATFNSVKNLRGPNSGILIYRSSFEAEIESSVFPMTQGGANETGMLGKFACLSEWGDRDLHDYAERIVAATRSLAEELHRCGIPLVSGGSDSHMLLLDLRGFTRSGAAIETDLESRGVLANRNLVPGDPRSPRETSGLRIGSTNLAILGYETSDLRLLANWLAGVIAEEEPTQETVDYLIDKYQQHLIAPVW